MHSAGELQVYPTVTKKEVDWAFHWEPQSRDKVESEKEAWLSKSDGNGDSVDKFVVGTPPSSSILFTVGASDILDTDPEWPRFHGGRLFYFNAKF
jgi:hypothetical protein